MTHRRNLKKHIVDIIVKDTPPDYKSFTLALEMEYGIDVEAGYTRNEVRSILYKIHALSLAV